MADDILGISAHFDISDIRNSIDEINQSLTKIGSKTSETSKKMDDAVKSIDMSALKQQIEQTEEAINGISDVLQKNAKEIEEYQQKISSAQSALGADGDKDALTSQIKEYQNAIADIQKNSQELSAEQATLQQALSQTSAEWKRISESAQGAEQTQRAAASSIAATASGANAVANIAEGTAVAGATAAITAKTVATGALSIATSDNIVKTEAAAESQIKLNTSEKEAQSALQKLNVEYENYNRTLAYISGQIRVVSAEIDILKEEIEEAKQSGEDMSSALEALDFKEGRLEGLYKEYDAIDEKQQKVIESAKRLLEQNNDASNSLQGLSDNFATITEKVNQWKSSLSDIDSINEKYKAQKETINAVKETIDELGNASQQNSEKAQSLIEEIEKIRDGQSMPSIFASDDTAKIDALKGKIEEYGDAVSKANAQATVAVDIQKQSIAALSNRISELSEQQKEAAAFGNAEAYNAITAQIEEYKKALEDARLKLEELQSQQQSTQSSVDEFNKTISVLDNGNVTSYQLLKDNVISLKDAFINFATGGGKFQESLGNIKTALNGLPMPLGGAISSIGAMTKALWAMCSTPIGAVLSAIVIALQAVYKYFTKSAEGQKVFTKITAYCGSIMASLTDIVISLGKYLYHLFADADKPMNAFAKGLKSTFTNAIKTVGSLLQGLGDTLKGIFTLDWESFEKGMKEIWDGVKSAASTAVDVVKTSIAGISGTISAIWDGLQNGVGVDSIGSAVSDMLTKAQSAANLADRQLQAQKQLAEVKKQELEYDKEIAEKRERIYRLKGEEKLKAINELMSKQKEKYDAELIVQNRLKDILLEKNSLHNKTLKDIAAERNAEMEILRIEAQRAASTRMTARMANSTKQSIENEKKRKEKEANREAKAAAAAAKKERSQSNALTSANAKYEQIIDSNSYARAKEYQSLEDKIADARIKAMKEGGAKVAAERQRQLEKELLQIDEQRQKSLKAEYKRQKAEFDAQQAIVKVKGGKIQQWSDDDFAESAEYKEINDKYEELSKLTREAQNREIAKEVSDAYQDDADKRKAIEEKYNDDIYKIQQLRADKEKELLEARTKEEAESIQSAIDALIASEAKATKEKGVKLIDFDFQLLKKNPEYVAAFEDLNNVSTETLEHLIKLFERFKGKAAESMNPEQLREYTDTLQSMYDALLGREDPFSQITAASAQYAAAEAEVKALEKKVKAYKKGSGVIANATKRERELTDAYQTQEAAEKALAKAKNKRNRAEAKYLKTVKNLHDKIKDLANAITGLGDTIGGTEGQILQLIGNVLSFVVTTSDGIKAVSATGAQAISTIEKASVILTIIQAAIQLLQFMSSLNKDAHAQYEEYAEKVSEVEKLTNSVNEYRLAVIKAAQEERNWFGTTALSDLKDAYVYHKGIVEAYVDAATAAQAIYQNESGGGWLTSAAKFLAKTVGSIVSLPGKLIAKGLEAIGIDMSGWLGDVVQWGNTALFGGVEGIIGKAVGNLARNADYYEEGTTAAINNLRIETRARSRGFLGSGIGGHSQQTQDLTEWAKEKYGAELFDENFLINIDLANQIIDDYGDKLVGSTKETLEKLIELREEYDKWIEEVEEYVSDMYSPLADDLTDALFNWLDTGEDVMDKFKEYASDTFRDIAKEFVKSMIYEQSFSEYKEKLKELYKMYSMGGMDEATLSSSVATLTQNWMNQVQSDSNAYQSFLDGVNKGFSQAGFDITDSGDNEESGAGAWSNLGEETGKALEGRFAAMQIQTTKIADTIAIVQIDISAINASVTAISANISEITDIQYSSLNRLNDIVANTAYLPKIHQAINEVYNKIKSI